MKTGDTFKIQQYKGSPIYKCLVLAVVDKDMIVYKFHGKNKELWHYEVKSKEEIDWKVEWTKEALKNAE